MSKKKASNPSLLEQLKADRVAQLALVGIVVLALFVCVILGATAYRLMTRSTVASVPTPNQPPSPTPDPLPTVTIIPTNTPTVGMSPEKFAYGQEIASKMERISEVEDRMKVLLKDIQFDNDEWFNDLVTQAETYQAITNEFSAMTPPADMIDGHKALIDALGDCNESNTSAITAVKELDTDYMTRAIELQDSCTAKLREAGIILLEASSD